MALYRKKPVVVEARQCTGTNKDDLLDWIGIKASVYGKVLTIQTLEGDMLSQVNDFIIKGVQGEFYPCKPEIFYQTYERVD